MMNGLFIWLCVFRMDLIHKGVIDLLYLIRDGSVAKEPVTSTNSIPISQTTEDEFWEDDVLPETVSEDNETKHDSSIDTQSSSSSNASTNSVSSFDSIVNDFLANVSNPEWRMQRTTDLWNQDRNIIYAECFEESYINSRIKSYQLVMKDYKEILEYGLGLIFEKQMEAVLLHCNPRAWYMPMIIEPEVDHCIICESHPPLYRVEVNDTFYYSFLYTSDGTRLVTFLRRKCKVCKCLYEHGTHTTNRIVSEGEGLSTNSIQSRFKNIVRHDHTNVHNGIKYFRHSRYTAFTLEFLERVDADVSIGADAFLTIVTKYNVLHKKTHEERYKQYPPFLKRNNTHFSVDLDRRRLTNAWFDKHIVECLVRQGTITDTSLLDSSGYIHILIIPILLCFVVCFVVRFAFV